MRNFVFKIINNFIKLRFPKVKQITTDELTQLLANINNQNTKKEYLHIFDVRTPEEYKVSHLQNAERVDFNQPSFADDWVKRLSISPDTTIIVYCSVGYRSAIVIGKLQKAGFTKVFNLEGGIFNWANVENAVFESSHQTSFVHPYNKIWEKLLKNG